MEISRVKNPTEFLMVAEELKELFRSYLERTKIDVPVEVMFENYRSFPLFHDYFLFLFKENEKIVGFLGANLLCNSRYSILYVFDVYAPKMAKELKRIMGDIQHIIGANGIWGEAKENIYRVYRIGLGGKGLQKVQFVRIAL